MGSTTSGLEPGTRSAAAGAEAAARSVATGVDQAIADFLSAETAALHAVDPAFAPFVAVARDLVSAGGKRLRPTFAYWGWRGVVGPAEAASGYATERVMPALAALELLHTFALIHDDVMDRSDLRRGRPTAHRVLARRHAEQGWRGDSGEYGLAGAVLIGDLCLIWADKLLARAALPATSILAARRVYDTMRVETVAGQYLDLVGEATTDRWSLARAMAVAHYKTASYTVQRPLQYGTALADRVAACGCHSADPDSRLNRELGRYGAAVGAAFQLRDDILGVYGDPTTTGKPAGDDLRRGKPTALVLAARRLAGEAQRAELDRRLGDPELTDADTAELTALVTEVGARAYVEQLIDRNLAAARAALARAPIDEQARTVLADLAVAAARRDG